MNNWILIPISICITILILYFLTSKTKKIKDSFRDIPYINQSTPQRLPPTFNQSTSQQTTKRLPPNFNQSTSQRRQPTFNQSKQILQRYNQPVQAQQQFKSKENFIPSDKWIGRKPGYVFKKDIKGLGYYKDKKKVSFSDTNQIFEIPSRSSSNINPYYK